MWGNRKQRTDEQQKKKARKNEMERKTQEAEEVDIFFSPLPADALSHSFLRCHLLLQTFTLSLTLSLRGTISDKAICREAFD